MKTAKTMRLSRAKNSRFGRFLCRLMGEERGAIMMEYVILAVLIAAACVVAVAMFGRTIVDMFGAASKGATGDHSGAKSAVQAAQDAQSDRTDQGAQNSDDLHK